jgi:hypothetical protein
MKWLRCILFSTFFMFGVSNVPPLTLAQSDDRAQPTADQSQTERGVGLDDRVPMSEDGNPVDESPPEDDVTPPDEDMMAPEPSPEDDLTPPDEAQD